MMNHEQQARHGKVQSIRGSVVDARSESHLPPIHRDPSRILPNLPLIFKQPVRVNRFDAGAAMDILCGNGYFLGGILPRWYVQDGILMQKILHGPNISGIQLHGERARKIVAMVLEDRAAVAAAA